MNAVPVVALSDASSPVAQERDRFGARLRESLCELGFVRVAEHGVAAQLIRRVYAHFERFFARADDEKRRCTAGADGQRGFTAFGVEHARDSGAPDLKEFFHVGRDAPGDPRFLANVWPEGQPGMREDALALYAALEGCAVRLLEPLAEALGLPRDALSSEVADGDSILRAVHYPPLPQGRDPASVRAAAHEDINLITLLCEATDAGLEIRPPGANDWIAVEVPPGQIVVDAGDMLARMTNDWIPATTHRVVTPEGSESRSRYALPFFLHPRRECDLSVRPEFVSRERPRRHPPITAGRFLDERLREIGLVS